MTGFEKTWLPRTQQQETLFSITQQLYTLTNISDRYVSVLIVAQAAFAVGCSGTCQISMIAWVILEWLHLPWTSSQLVTAKSPHDWLVRLGIDLAVLCTMWS